MTIPAVALVTCFARAAVTTDGVITVSFHVTVVSVCHTLVDIWCKKVNIHEYYFHKIFTSCCSVCKEHWLYYVKLRLLQYLYIYIYI
jgi:hypothetical protein